MDKSIVWQSTGVHIPDIMLLAKLQSILMDTLSITVYKLVCNINNIILVYRYKT